MIGGGEPSFLPGDPQQRKPIRSRVRTDAGGHPITANRCRQATDFCSTSSDHTGTIRRPLAMPAARMSLLLHLSDLHLGSVKDSDILDDFKSDIEPLERRLSRQRVLKETLTQLSIQLSGKEDLYAVVISGDITVMSIGTVRQAQPASTRWPEVTFPRMERRICFGGIAERSARRADDSEFKDQRRCLRSVSYPTPSWHATA